MVYRNLSKSIEKLILNFKMRKLNRWTLQELEILKSKYPLEGSNVAKFLGRSSDSVRHKAKELNISFIGYLWTDEQSMILKNLYPKMGASKELQSILNKTKKMIFSKAQAMDLKCSDEFLHSKRMVNNHNFIGYKCISGKYIASLKQSAVHRKLDHPLLDRSIDSYEYLYSIVTKKCPLSNLEIVFPITTTDRNATASLDRIDSTKGYIKGNVRWVHKIINKFRNNLSDEQFLFLCNKVSSLHQINNLDIEIDSLFPKVQTHKVKQGTKHKRKLSVEQYKQIYEKFANKENTIIELSKIYHVTRGTIRFIIKRVEAGLYE